MQANLINVAYLVAAVLFILGLKGLTSPRTAVRGNLLGQFRVTGEIVWNLAHATRQFRRSVFSSAPLMATENKFKCRHPMSIEHDNRIGSQLVQDFPTQPVQACDYGEFFTLVEFQSNLLG